MFLFLYKANNAKSVATIITIIVQYIGDIHRHSHQIFTNNALIFAIDATDIQPKYKLNGVSTRYLFTIFHVFLHMLIFFDIIINTIKNNNIINTDRNIF